MPAMNGRRDVELRYADAPAMALNATRIAVMARSHEVCLRAQSAWMPERRPSGPERVVDGTATRRAAVPAMYAKAVIAPPARMANGMVRRGFSISSPMAEPASTPAKAKTMVDQKTASLSDQWRAKELLV